MHLEKLAGGCGMNEKKVVAVIMEGPSEEAALGSILKEYFAGEEVQFVVVHGDITTADYTSVDNILMKINDFIVKVEQKYGYDTEDFLRIIHIVDTDGVFTKGVVTKADVDSVQYHTDRIETRDVDYINFRNEKKAEILFKLYSSGKVNGVSYRIYFNSCNLEHVLFNELKDFTDVEKEEMSDDFAEQYENNVAEFIEFISKKSVAAEGTYKQTWRFIEKGINSLHQYTNMHLIFKE